MKHLKELFGKNSSKNGSHKQKHKGAQTAPAAPAATSAAADVPTASATAAGPSSAGPSASASAPVTGAQPAAGAAGTRPVTAASTTAPAVSSAGPTQAQPSYSSSTVPGSSEPYQRANTQHDVGPLASEVDMAGQLEPEPEAGIAAEAPSQEPESSVIAVAEHCPAAMLKDTWTLDAFEIRSKMYAGHISSVYRAVDKNSGITVALKLYKRAMLNDMERHQIAREIWLHIQLNHPSIIALYAAWKDKDYIYLVLEWAPEGNVFTFAQSRGGRLPENVVVPMILEPTMSALHYIHQLGMIHRDVKPENILLTTSYQIKLADFGLSIHSNYEVANTRLGTIDYLSPEILDCPVKAHPQDHKANPQKWYTNKVDCWSIGVLAYELLTGRTPFEARTPQETLLKIKTQEVFYPQNLSFGSVNFMRGALIRDPAQRMGMPDLMAHPWVLGHRRAPTMPHMRSRAATQGEVTVQVKSHAGNEVGALTAAAGSSGARIQSFGSMKVQHSAGEGAQHSCPQVLHAQVSAPAAAITDAAQCAEAAGAIAAHRGPSTLGKSYSPSPIHGAAAAAADMDAEVGACTETRMETDEHFI